MSKLRVGHQDSDKTFKVHIDGYDVLPYLTGETDDSPREWFFYTSHDAQIARFSAWPKNDINQMPTTVRIARG